MDNRPECRNPCQPQEVTLAVETIAAIVEHLAYVAIIETGTASYRLAAPHSRRLQGS